MLCERKTHIGGGACDSSQTASPLVGSTPSALHYGYNICIRTGFLRLLNSPRGSSYGWPELCHASTQDNLSHSATCNICPLPRIPLPCISLPYNPLHLKCTRCLRMACHGLVWASMCPRCLRVICHGQVGDSKCPHCLRMHGLRWPGASRAPPPGCHVSCCLTTHYFAARSLQPCSPQPSAMQPSVRCPATRIPLPHIPAALLPAALHPPTLHPAA